MSGVKFDSEKADMSLLSSYALEAIAAVMTKGKTKYGADNWRGGIAFSRLFAAVQRHLLAYNRGETKDPETGLSHLAHASCGLMMMLEFEATCPNLNDLYHCKQGARDMLVEQIDSMQKKVMESMAKVSEPKIVVNGDSTQNEEIKKYDPILPGSKFVHKKYSEDIITVSGIHAAQTPGICYVKYTYDNCPDAGKFTTMIDKFLEEFTTLEAEPMNCRMKDCTLCDPAAPKHVEFIFERGDNDSE